MLRFAVPIALALAFSTALRAEPVVIGYERFHAKQPTAEAGRLLYNELGCANCHGGDTGLPARRGPVLTSITKRIQPDWLRSYLADPSTARAGTSMPHLFDPTDKASIEAVVQYLGSLAAKKEPKPKQAKYVNAERGSDVFHTLGCVACHEPASDFQPPPGKPKASDYTHRSIAFPDLAEKYSLSSLTDFLREPLKTRTDGRMPHVVMDDSDYTDLAAHLLDFQQSDGSNAQGIQPLEPDAALVAKGHSIVTALRCASCHDLPKDVAAQPIPLHRAEGGCLAPNSAPGVPRYALSEAQRSALKAHLAAGDEPLSTKQTTTLTLQALNCFACHDRDGLGGPDAARKAYFTGDHNLGDTGLYPPPLTHAGRKLQPAWLSDVFAGKARVRPYLQTQMPRYGKATDSLVALFAEADAKPSAPLPLGDITVAPKLLGTLGGVGCIICHRWRERPSLGIQAMDLSTLGQRLQPAWLQEYLINPAGYRPGTLMPSFWPLGKAANQEILHGNTAQQIASIYAFAKSGRGEPEGFPSITSGEFELIPKDRPIIQRTFMEGVGTHAILVGFPAGIHIAYDGQLARPAMAWKGKFFDAYNTWFTRAAPFEKPLGSSVVTWPTPSTAATSEDKHFQGYTLDATHVPTFIYTLGKVRVQERFSAEKDVLKRSLTWDATALPELAISHPEGVTITEQAGSIAGQRTFIYSWK